MKKFIIAAGIVIISLMVLLISRDLIIKSVVTKAASGVLGAPVRIGGFSLDMLSSTIKISGFKIHNPEKFPEGILVSCPKIKVIYDRNTLFKKERHFLLIEIELAEMGLVKNKVGKLNVDSLKIVGQSDSSSSSPVRIDLFNFSIGRIVYKDYTVGPEPVVRVYNINKQKSYKGVPSARQLALLVLSEPMKNAAIKNAQIYGAVMLTGVAVLPVAIAATIIGKDSVRQVVDAGGERVYEVSLEAVKRMGKITKTEASKGIIKANINGVAVTLIFKKITDSNKTEITISARKYMLPKADIAGGVLYQIIDKLQ